ncbi:pYEATS domain-containing protein [Algoriphagus sp.]|uniref:pYEATS domain-containing protein n=1 Tax=Algoriphagus sp. TaxID=1872435 RepID=UPI0025E63311|nr:pYEATS domain-containing protein [Algoriphagus sp.]
MEKLEFKIYNGGFDYSTKQSATYKGKDSWDWSIWIESSDSGLEQIDYVIYNLHSSYKNPVKKINSRTNNFRLDSSGWGTFTIYIRLHFLDKSILDLEHELELYYPFEMEEKANSKFLSLIQESPTLGSLPTDLISLKDKLNSSEDEFEKLRIKNEIEEKTGFLDQIKSSANQFFENKNIEMDKFEPNELKDFLKNDDQIPF